MDEYKKKIKKSERYNEFSDEHQFNTEVEHVEGKVKKKKKKLDVNPVNKKKKKKSKRHSDEFSDEHQFNTEVEDVEGKLKKKKKVLEVDLGNKKKKKKSKRHSDEFSDEHQFNTEVERVEGKLKKKKKVLEVDLGNKKKKKKSKRHSDEFSDEHQFNTEVEHVEGMLKKKKKMLDVNPVKKKKKKKSKRHSDEFSDEHQFNSEAEYIVGRLKKKKNKLKVNLANEEINEYNNCNSYGYMMKLKESEKVSQLHHNTLMLDNNKSDGTYDGTKLKKRKIQISFHSDTQGDNGDRDVENDLLKSKSKKLKLTHCLSTNTHPSESSSKEVNNIENNTERYFAKKSKKSKKDCPSGEEPDSKEFAFDGTVKEKKMNSRQTLDPVTERKLIACDVSNNNFSGEVNVDEFYSENGKRTSFTQGKISEKYNYNICSNIPFAAKDQEKNSSHSDRNVARLFENVNSMSVDDLDYDDDDYAEQQQFKKKRKLIKYVELDSDDLEESEDDCTDFTVTPLYNTSSLNSTGKCVGLVPGMQKEIPHKSFDEILYKIPPGEGIPLEDIEEVPDDKCYWKMREEKMFDKFTEEEIEQEIMNKIYFIHDYFKRFETGKLTDEELKEVRPRNFHEPYFPTPKHMEFFENLDIKITWPLNELHELCQNYIHCTPEITQKIRTMGLQFATHCSTHEEEKKVLRNWMKFQKEYGFYDLRPLTSVRTTRIIIDDDGNISFRAFKYISIKNRRKLALYLVRGLPNRTPKFALGRLKFWAMNLEDNKVSKKKLAIPGRTVAKMVYMLKRFGANFSAVELVVGKYIEHYFRNCFNVHVRLQNLKFRCGVWTDAETERLKRGIIEVMKVKSWREAEKKKIKWLKLIPYVRTRNINLMMDHFLTMCRTGYEREKMKRYTFWAKLIHVIYDSGVDHISLMDWESIAEHFPGKNASCVKLSFRNIFFTKVPFQHQSVLGDGIIYLYNKFLPRLQKILSIAGEPYNLDGPSQSSSEGEGEKLPTQCDIDDLPNKCAEEEVDDPNSVGLGCHSDLTQAEIC